VGHLGIGDVLPVQGRMLRIVGVTTGPGSFMIGMVFVRHDAANALLATPDTTSFVLVGCRCRKPHPWAMTCRFSDTAEDRDTGYARMVHRAIAAALPGAHERVHPYTPHAHERRR